MHTAVLHKELQTTLFRYLRKSDVWQLVYEDDLAAIFRWVGQGKSDFSESEVEVLTPESDREAQERRGTAAG
jgi:hypothetical protein